jgi:hypothetical protein
LIGGGYNGRALRNLYQFVQNSPLDAVDVLGLVDLGTVSEMKKKGCCYIFTIKVDAKGYDYKSPKKLVKSMGKNQGGGVGHSWVRLENTTTGYSIEGGHSGETQDAGKNPGITDTAFLTYAGGVVALASLSASDPSPMPMISEADPANPIRWLRYIYEDGHWASGSGGHTKVTGECSWCLDASEFGSVKAKIDSLMSGGGAALEAYGLTGKQCTSTAADIADAGGISLDPFVNLTFPNTLSIDGQTIRLWSDSTYSTLKFALPEKMESEIKSWSGTKTKICK